MSLRPTRPPRARFISHTRVYARMNVPTYAHERETRARIPSGVCYEGVYWGYTKGKRWKEASSKEKLQKSRAKAASPGKEIIASVLRAIKIEIGRNRLGNALITPVFTHLRRSLLDEITSRVPTLSFCKVPLEISNECVEVETRMHAARDERREVSRFITN